MKRVFFLIFLFVFPLVKAQTHKIVYLRKINFIDTIQMTSKFPEKLLRQALTPDTLQNPDSTLSRTKMKNAVIQRLTSIRKITITNKRWKITKFEANDLRAGMSGMLQGADGLIVGDKKNKRLYKLSAEKEIINSKPDTYKPAAHIKILKTVKVDNRYKVFFTENNGNGTDYKIAMIDPKLPSYVSPSRLPKEMKKLGGVRKVVGYNKNHPTKVVIRSLVTYGKTDFKQFDDVIVKIKQYDKKNSK